MQGPKLPPCWTFGRKKWNHGAPRSHKVLGKVRGPGGKWVCPDSEECDPQVASADRLTTVPLPCTLDEINNENMQDFFASGAYSAPLGGVVVMEATPVSEEHA